MGSVSEKLTATLTSLLTAINEHLELLSRTEDPDVKQKIATVIKTLAESQKSIAEAIDFTYDEDLGFLNDDSFEDDYYDDNDDELGNLIDARHFEAKKRSDTQKKHGKKKQDSSIKKLEDEDMPF